MADQHTGLHPGTEADFERDNNPFAFAPGHMTKLLNPKSLGAFHAMGGLVGLEKALRTDRNSGLSEQELDGKVTFEDANAAASIPADSDRQSMSDSAPQPSQTLRKHTSFPMELPSAVSSSSYHNPTPFEGFDTISYYDPTLFYALSGYPETLNAAPWSEPVSNTPPAPVADDEYAFLAELHAVFLFEHSGSMADSLWRDTADALTPQALQSHRGFDAGRNLDNLATNNYKATWPDLKNPMSFAHVTDGFPDHEDHGARTRLAKKLDYFDQLRWQAEVFKRRSYGPCYGTDWKERWSLECQISQRYHRRDSWKPSRIVALLGIASFWPTAAAYEKTFGGNLGLGLRNANDALGASVLNIDPVQNSLSDFYRWLTILLPPAFLLFGLLTSAWVLLRDKGASNRQTTVSEKHNFCWLMTFMASVSCWVLSATTNGPSDGKSVAFSAWVALFAIYQSLNCRAFSHHKIYLFTSLLGGIIAGSIIAGAMIAPGHESRGNAMVEQALVVSPTVLTAWSWLTANIQRGVENGQGVNNTGQLDLEHQAIELADR